MKVFIAYPITNDPTGGGNQFLRCLKKEFIKTENYVEDCKEADIILYNGHHEVELVSKLKGRYPGKKFIHRIDGLQKLYNKPSDARQDIAINFNKLSNGTVFQSHWAKDEFSKINFNPPKSIVVHNCADEQIFNKISRVKAFGSKTKLLCTSWSPNINKGFNFYRLLDKKLDFNKYDFTFIGNKPHDINYKNIKCFSPRNSQEISQELKKTDIFVSATVNDCCSNSIIEALSCGVPVFALSSGGNPELVKDGGLLFDNIEDFLKNIERLRTNLSFYKKMISVKTIKDVAASYIEFFKCI